MDKYAIYLRKSRADAELEMAGEGETLSRHRSALLELAKKKGLFISDVYEEIISGDSIACRPEMQKLLQSVADGEYKGVLVMEVERLARGDTVDQGIVSQVFKASRTLIITPYKTYDPSNDLDADFFEFRLFFARQEYRAINRRMQAGRLASIKEGKYGGSRKVYGYQRVKLENQKGWSLKVVPEEARVIRLIFDWYLNGLEGQPVGVPSIAKHLNSMGVRSPSGGRWVTSSVRNILCCEILRGNVTWQKRCYTKPVSGITPKIKHPVNPNAVIVKGLHEPIVNSDTFERVQFKLKNNPPAPASTAAMVNPLSGIVICSNCGRTLIRRTTSTTPYPILCCKTEGCPTVGIQLKFVEDAIMDTLREWKKAYSTTAQLSKPKEDDQIKTIEASLSALQAQLNRIYDLFENGIYSNEEFLTRKDEVSQKIEAANAQLTLLKNQKTTREKSIAQIIPQLETVLSLYNKSESALEKNQLLKMVISKVVYTKTVKCHRNQDPSQYLKLQIFPRINL